MKPQSTVVGFFSRLERRAREIDSLLCVGLDPHPADLTTATAEAAEAFCLRLIDETAELATTFKPNAAFFEALGTQGISVLARVIAAVPEGIPVILDAKRGDITSTAQAYARAAFYVLAADAVTVNPYLGYDALAPFLENPEKGVFLLCKTSNPGAGEIQDLLVARQAEESTSPKDLQATMHTVYETVAQLAQAWNKRDNLGLVVGATQPEALARVRTLAPDLWILAPGIGAQGGELEKALRAGLRADGWGLLVPVSRGISRSDNPRQAAQDLREEINRMRNRQPSTSSQPPLTLNDKPSKYEQDLSTLADGLIEAGCVKFGDFTLKSGSKSPIYLDLRLLVSFPGLLDRAARAYMPILRQLSFDRLAALPYAALPIGTAISLLGEWPLIYPRKETKEYGTKAEIEGLYQSGEHVVVIDDLATTGGSKLEAIEKLEAMGLQVTDVVVLIDRQSGADQELAKRGYKFHAVFHLSQLLDRWRSSDRISEEQVEAVRRFLAMLPTA